MHKDLIWLRLCCWWWWW